MTFKKMLEVLAYLNCQGWIGTSPGGELTLTPVSQPNWLQHKWLLSRGFIYETAPDTAYGQGDYVYRPRITKRKQ